MLRGSVILVVVLLLASPMAAARYAVENLFQSSWDWNGEGRPAKSVFLFPQDITVDAAGNLYVIHFWGHMGGRLVIRIGADGIAHRVAGGGTLAPADGVKATDATIFARGIAVDAAGAIYVSDTSRYQIYKIGTDGKIAVYAGSGVRGYSGDDGRAVDAALMNPIDMGLDDAGNLYFADSYRVRRITPQGIIRTVAGNGSSGMSTNGAQATATPISVQTLAVEKSGAFLIAPLRTYPIFRVGTDGIIRRLAGGAPLSVNDNPDGTKVNLGDVMGLGVAPDGTAYSTQMFKWGRVRRIAPSGAVTTVAGTGPWTIAGDGGDAATASISRPGAVHVDARGDIWFADHLTVRRISEGKIETVAGTHDATFLGAGGPLAEAQTRRISAITQDAGGNFYIADQLTSSIYLLTPSLTQMRRIAGTGFPGFTVDAGPALQVPLDRPQAVDVDAAGNVYIAEGQRVRKLLPNGQITTIAGTDYADEFFIEGGIATSFNVEPYALRLSRSGELYVASFERIFRIGADGRAHSVVETSSTSLGMDFDADGSLYFSDPTAHVVRKVSPAGAVQTIAGAGSAGFSGDGGLATAAQLNTPNAVRVDAAGNVLVADSRNNRIRRISKAGAIETILGGGSGYGNDWESTTVAIQIYNGTYSIPGGIHIGEGGAIWVADTAYVTRLNQRQLFLNWVYNCASFVSGPVAPGECFAFYGDEIGPASLVSAAYSEDGNLARTVSDTQVLVNGNAVPLIFVSKDFNAALMPYNVSGAVRLEVQRPGGKTNAIDLTVAPTMPGLFTYAGGTGQIVAVNAENWKFNGSSEAATRGQWMTIFLTGQGAVTPVVGDGVAITGSPSWPSPATPVQIRVGGVDVPSGDIWAGLTYQGVLQVNFKIPETAPTGNVPLLVTMGAAASQQGATVNVK